MLRLLKLWRLLGNDARLLMVALRSPNRPRWLLPALLLLLVFALDPFNFAMPGLGIIDDLVLLPLLLRAIVKLAGAERLAAPNVGPR
jgi:uncharacterized membrane protein YkvA (DUF1232 family)